MLGLFKGKKQNPKKEITDMLNDILEKGDFSLSFQISEKEEMFQVDIFGEDEGLLKTREGKLLQAFQFYFLCALKKKFPEFKGRITVDSNNFWEEKRNRLFSLVENLVKKAAETGHPVILNRSLPPNERRLVHEKVSKDKRVKSLSVGEGFLKSIKFVPNKMKK